MNELSKSGRAPRCIQTFIDDTALKKITLRMGPKVVCFMVANNRGVDDCARFLDAHDKPLNRYTIRWRDAADSTTQ